MFNKKIVIYLIIIMFSFLKTSMSENSKTFYDFKINSINGEELNLSIFKDKTILLVNVASKCGFTKQYDDLQKLYDDYKEKGLVVIGIPSNQFGGQEPGTETEIKNLRRQNGKLENIDKSETENDSIVLLMTEINSKGEHKDGGVFEQEVTVLPEVVKSKKVKKQLLNISVGDEIKLNVFDLFNDNEMVISHSLGIEKEAVGSLSNNFTGKVKEVKRVLPAELNQEFYDLVMGPGAVTSEEEFNKKIEENLGSYYVAESEKQLEAEINSVVEKNHPLTLPDYFLKRWLQGTKPETYTADKVDELYANESNVLRKQLIREKIAEKENVEVSDEDINQTSFAYTAQMLRQYGLNNPDPAMIQNFEAKNREEKNYLLRIRDVVVEKKVIDKVKEMITIKPKKISVDKFYDEIKKFNDKK